MARNYPVDSATTLGRFLLREVKIQQWRIPYLIQCKGVRVYRDRAFVRIDGPDTRLKDGDYVQVDDPLTEACTKALAAIPAADYRDCAFVPGTSPFDRQMAGVLDNRPQTIRIDNPLIDSLAGFIRALGNDTAVDKPIRHLLVASHANPEGHLFIRLSILAAASISYEDLEAAVKDKSLLVDSRLLEPRPKDDGGNPVAAAFLFRGCRIGLATPYLKKLKEALGGTVTVIAPKHFHDAAQNSKPTGYVEYMSYNFPIYRPKAFRNQGEAVKAFTGTGFTRIDGQPVPPKLWPGWIPVKVLNKQGNNPVPATIVSPITNARESIPGYFRYTFRQFLKQDGSVNLPKDPGDEKGRKKAVRDDLVKNLPRYQDTHPFPEYVRYGYKTMDEFMDGWEWKFAYDKSSNLLSYNATRHEYTVIRPIAEPAKNTLILNFYPSGKAKKTAKPIEMLVPSDARFFATV
jgi:hypothetical protein